MEAFITLWRNRDAECQQALSIRGRGDGGEVRGLYENEKGKKKQIRLTGDQPNVSDSNEALVAHGNA